MSNLVSIPTALCLPAPDIEALVQGRMVAVMPRTFINPGQQFVLHPCDVSTNLLPVEQYYRSSFLPIARTTLTQLGSETALIKAWARCESCQGVSDTKALAVLSQLTVWTEEGLQEVLRQQQHIFLAYLRVYQLPQPIEVAINPSTKDKIGKFIGLPNSLTISESLPVLSDRIFAQRRLQLEKLEPPLHPELEELQSAIALLPTSNPAAEELDQSIRIFLGWASNQTVKQPDPELAWINDIAALGNRSKEEDDEKKINWQAGTDFENVVRKSLEFLGFTIDYSHKGGAGGLDLFCSKPYPLVGECKAGKKIPNPTAVQLLNLATLRLQNPELIKKSTKLIIGPGEPLKQLKDAALVHGMAIINPETLEKLVKLQSKYRGAVDLFKLKEYLKPGQADDEVEKYIEQVSKEIKLRSHLVQLVKKQIENTGDENVGVDNLQGAYVYSNPPQPLKREEMHEILVELSSPLTGYLGRNKGDDWGRDRFYFLRDLKVD